MPDKIISNIIDPLETSIADDVGNMHEDELESISHSFDKTLADALRSFNSTAFDDDGFIKKMRDLDTNNKHDKDVMRNVLNGIRSDYVSVESMNQSELLLRRDMENICTQMPEMRDVINVIRDSIIECNVATGEVSRSLIFENHEYNEAMETQVEELETYHELHMNIKNVVVPSGLRHGEVNIQVTPYRKLFAEIEALRAAKTPGGRKTSPIREFKESVPPEILKSFKDHTDLYSDVNLKALTESVSGGAKVDTSDEYKIDNGTGSQISANIKDDALTSKSLTELLKSIEVSNSTSIMMEEMGIEGFEKFIHKEYTESIKLSKLDKNDSDTHFSESMSFNKVTNGVFGDIDQDDVEIGNYASVKGCYVKYLDGLRTVPIRMDKRVIGFYYVSTTMDLQTNASQPNGIVDLSYQHYTKDKNLVDRLSNMIIKSFDKTMLDKNIKLKHEIAEIVMAHKFSEGKLSFIYIPENEVVRIVLNEDAYGRGHSVLEPSMFPARSYLMLTMYNMLYTLNNNTTRIHYLKSSGLNKDYAAQIQRKMRKFQSRRITIDDIYSYSGVLNKVGGMGEMMIPEGRSGFKALETDTIEAVPNPINMEFLEQQRREAISGTGVPHLMMINAIDEADFAKTLEMANARFLSTVSSYKIDFNKGLTKLYQILMKYSTDLEIDEIQSFKFKFHAIKQQELSITQEMITNFNAMVEMISSIFYRKDEMEDDKQVPTSKQMHLRRELAKKYLPQLDFEELEDIIKHVDTAANDDTLQKRVNDLNIDNNDLDTITPKS